ncbi:MAG: SRPBCC family protein [Labilithrix sp.]
MSTELTVKKSVVVNVPIAHAFEVFTKRFDLWWPRAHHIGKVDMKEAIMEPHEGGRWYEKGVDGSECDWGKVLTWAPPGKVALSWHLQGDWSYDPDPAHASRIEVTFTEESGRTRVELVHSGIERAKGGQALHDGVSAEGGWASLLDLFAKQAAA